MIIRGHHKVERVYRREGPLGHGFEMGSKHTVGDCDCHITLILHR